jgi:hypothetical protein
VEGFQTWCLTTGSVGFRARLLFQNMVVMSAFRFGFEMVGFFVSDCNINIFGDSLETINSVCLSSRIAGKLDL